MGQCTTQRLQLVCWHLERLLDLACISLPLVHWNRRHHPLSLSLCDASWVAAGGTNLSCRWCKLPTHHRVPTEATPVPNKTSLDWRNRFVVARARNDGVWSYPLANRLKIFEPNLCLPKNFVDKIIGALHLRTSIKIMFFGILTWFTSNLDKHRGVCYIWSQF